MHYACMNGHFESVVILLHFNALPDGAPLPEPPPESSETSSGDEEDEDDENKVVNQTLTRPVHLAAKRGAG